MFRRLTDDLRSIEIETLLEESDPKERRALVRPAYERLITALWEGEHPPSLQTGIWESHYVPAEHRVYLGLIDHGTEIEIGELRWARHLHATFWHEFGHSRHSRSLKSLEDERLDLALGLLEDIRMERCLVRNFGERCRPWLRFNVLAEIDVDLLAQRTAADEWGALCTVICGRTCAGTVQDEDADQLRAVSASVAELAAELAPTWQAFAALEDDELSADRTRGLAEVIGPHVPAAWLGE